MSVDLGVGFDPYATWLQIQDKQRPLNPYQLLNLKVLETDMNKIRAAITRQRSYLEARKEEANPQLWERINNEVEDAIASMLDPDRKQLLDAAFKRQANLRSRSSTDPKAAIASAGGTVGDTIQCRKCGTANASARRFCSGCGEGLFDQCPQCGAEVTTEEKFCGRCGTNLYETRRKSEEEFEGRLQKARLLQQNHRFGEAMEVLRELAVIEDVKYERFAAKAVQLMERFKEERASLEERAHKRLERARHYLAAYSYEKAFEKLDDIPETLRTPEIRDLLREVNAKKNELLQLGGDIREALAQNRKHDLLPKIERLLALKPDHAQGRELAEQLRDYICKSAKKKLMTHSYDEARTMLESIPTFARNEEVEKLTDKALELDSLAMDLRLSPIADDTLIALGERLVKISPTDTDAQKQLQEIKQRRATKPADPRLVYPAWGTPPRRTLLNMPVEWLGHITRSEVASSAVSTTLREHPGQFFVALGLALQAREQAAVNVNLLPAEKTGFLGRFALPMRKAAPKGGWGLDLTPGGLKAIRLGAELKDGKVCIEAAVYLPHSKPLNQAGDEVASSEIVLETLNAFREQYPFPKEKEKRDAVMVGLTGARVLGRFFELPPVSSRKLHDLVLYEARHQVPISLEELNWGYQVLREAEGKTADENSRHVMLLAAKDFHVRERINLCKSAEIPVDGVAAEPCALHNAFVYEFLSEDENPRHVAFMDIGRLGSNFVVSSRKDLWFRTSGNCGDDFTNALVRTFKLTHSLAEDLKLAPNKARRFYQLQDAVNPLFVQVGSEIERSLGSFAKQFTDRPVERLYLTGGAVGMHGLLRYLVHSR